MTLDEAVAILTQELPGWRWSVSLCSVSCDANCAPEGYHQGGVDAHLTDGEELLPPEERVFDNGFTIDLLQPSTPALALLYVMRLAVEAKEAHAKGLKPNRSE